ncbi:hypothetical protein [Paracoccus yeei]|uniref:hypothetical protein n=1 Tax=Paracoccus yeei TaxID=147645 RepID=UPI003BF7AD3D
MTEKNLEVQVGEEVVPEIIADAIAEQVVQRIVRDPKLIGALVKGINHHKMRNG